MPVRSETTDSTTSAGSAVRMRSSWRRIWSTVATTLASGLALDIEDDGALALLPGADALVLEAIRHGRHVAEAHRRAAAHGDGDAR